MFVLALCGIFSNLLELEMGGSNPKTSREEREPKFERTGGQEKIATS
jgi:hypothetical protein